MSKKYEYAECQNCGHLDSSNYIGLNCPICKKSIMESRYPSLTEELYDQEEDLESFEDLDEDYDNDDDDNDDY